MPYPAGRRRPARGLEAELLEGADPIVRHADSSATFSSCMRWSKAKTRIAAGAVVQAVGRPVDLLELGVLAQRPGSDAAVEENCSSTQDG